MKRNWKIIYSNYSGAEKKAIELINKEMGSLILRDPNVYTIHVLACEKADSAVIDKNAVIIGTYGENKFIRDYIDISEIPEDGYVVKVFDNPKQAENKLVIITALNAVEVFYGAVDFVDDFFAYAAPRRNILEFPDELFTQKLPDYYSASAPVFKTRNIFTWGHPINDYMDYIDNMARMKLNEIIFWNDYVPLNAKDVVDYAHEYGMKVIWGYAWGWSRKCAEIDFDSLDELTDSIIKKYEDEYKDAGCDGIYFQSFTELGSDYIGDKLIAEVVTDFVNKTADRLLEKYPKLDIRFGLHALSTKNHLEYIKNVDKRISIIWEDCGSFPYHYEPTPNEEYENTVDFTGKILTLRENVADGVLYKGLVTMDWEGDYFAHQSGPYIMGKASQKTIESDKAQIKPIWKKYQSSWLQNGIYAYNMTKHIHSLCGRYATVGIAGQLSGGIWFPAALCAEILWNCESPYEEILKKVTMRKSVDMV